MACNGPLIRLRPSDADFSEVKQTLDPYSQTRDLSYTFAGPTRFSLAVDPFGFRWALAARSQLTQTSTQPDPEDNSQEAFGYRAILSVLEHLASFETHYREVFGAPTTLADVVAEQHARRDAGMPWVNPTRLVTLENTLLHVKLNSTTYPTLSGDTITEALDLLQESHDSMMETLRS